MLEQTVYTIRERFGCVHIFRSCGGKSTTHMFRRSALCDATWAAHKQHRVFGTNTQHIRGDIQVGSAVPETPKILNSERHIPAHTYLMGAPALWVRHSDYRMSNMRKTGAGDSYRPRGTRTIVLNIHMIPLTKVCMRC